MRRLLHELNTLVMISATKKSYHWSDFFFDTIIRNLIKENNRDNIDLITKV